MADATGTAMHEDALAHPQRRTHHQRFPGRAADQGEAGGLEVTQCRRFLADNAFGGDVVLGIASRTIEDLWRVPDLVARREARHARPDRFDDTGDVMPGNARQWHQIGVITAPDLEIQRIDGRCMHPHQYLPCLRHWLGYVAQLEGLRAAK